MKSLLTIALLSISALSIAQTKADLPRSEFAVSLSESSLRLKPGESKTLTVTILRSRSFSKEKGKLGLMGELPKGVTVSFEPTEGNFETSVATIAASTEAAAGVYNLVLSSTLSGKKKGSIVKLTVGADQVAAK